ncbi:MAG TPA: ARMT1-like domain-containing protein [Clostridia bacterium]|nr:ARMT1-like domain-containing protein [Clostridia bacterium]
MKLQYECLTCIIAQVLNVAKMLNFDEAHKEAAMRESLAYLSGANYEGCTPESMGELWELLLKHAETGDPYAVVKSLCNQEAMKMESHVRQAILNSGDPLGRALKFAVAGNLVDYGLEHPVSLEEQNRQVDEIAATPFVVDDSLELKEALRKAETLLYLCDNAGEILFDKLLIEEIRREFPQIQATCVVKGTPVLNDVTMADALEVGLDQAARVIDNGDGCPGTVLHRTSESFRREYEAADIVISKGQGNFESLTGQPKANIFFLFMAKCDAICQIVGTSKLSMLCKKNEPHLN